MSSATLTALAGHITDHDLPWTNIGFYTTKLDVQLVGGSADALARWASTLGGVVWEMWDFRDTEPAAWHVHARGDLDGDVNVWCSLPGDFGDTEAEVEARMIGLVAAVAAASDEVLARVNNQFADDLESALGIRHAEGADRD